MADDHIYNLREEREARAIKKFLKEESQFKGFPNRLSIEEIPTVHLTGCRFGGRNANEQRMELLIYDDSGPYKIPAGKLICTREQWDAMKRVGDQTFGITPLLTHQLKLD